MIKTFILLNLFIMISTAGCGQSKLGGEPTKSLPPGVLCETRDSILLNDHDGIKSYFTMVQIREPINYHPALDSVLFDKVVFTINYTISENSTYSRSEISHVAHFVKENDNSNYKIYEWSILSNWETRESKLNAFVPMSFEATFPAEYTFMGDSDNEALLAVTAWKYAKKHCDDEDAIRK